MTIGFGQTVFFNVLTPARLLSSSNIAGSYYNGPTNNGVGATLTIDATSLTIDGVVVNVGDRVLLNGQTLPYENGVYFVDSINTAVVLARAFDQQSVEQLKAGQFIFIGAGTVNAGRYVCLVEPLPQHIGVDAFTYTESSTGGGGVIGPTTPGHIAVFKDTIGTIGQNSDPAINNSDLSAGFNGSAGDLIAWPPQTDKGSVLILANANTGNYRTTLTNAPLGQTTTFTLPDPANTNAKIVAAAGTTPFVNGNLVFASGSNGLIEDGGATLVAGITSAWSGGGTTNTFVAPGLSSGYVGSASIVTSTNPVSIVKAVPNLAGTLIITFSADPGANTTVSYIYASAAL